MSLTEEQKQRIEENRKKALEKRASRSINHTTIPVVNTAPQINENRTKDEWKNTSSALSMPMQTVSLNTGHSSSRTFNTILSFNEPQTSSKTTNSEATTMQAKKFYSNAKQMKGTFVLFSRQRFFIDMGYNLKALELFKTFSDRNYDAQTKRWNFPIKDHDVIVLKLRTLQPDVIFSPLPANIVKIFSRTSAQKEIKTYDLTTLDPVCFNALLPFQEIGVNFGIQCDGKLLIADDMGLGKTIQAIAIAHFFKKDWPLLVVAPSSVRYSWIESFRMWLPSESHQVTVINSGKDHITNDKIIVVSYDLLTKRKDDLLKKGFRSVIMDESHFLKNFKSARTKAAQLIMKNMKRIIMLSGTPALSRPVELFPQISALKPKVFSNNMDFGVRYCNGSKRPWGWDFSGSSNMEELQLLLEETVMIRRLKSEVMSQLPAKRRQMILLDPSMLKCNDKVLQCMSKKMSSKSLKGMERRGVLLEYFHQTGTVKLRAVCQYIKDLLEADKKFICFAHHRIVLDGISNAVEESKTEYIRIDGSTSSEQRKILVDKFQVKESCKVAVLSINAANAGITLTAAGLVVFAELFWNPGILTQAEDRAHRIGQQDSVIVQYLVARGTADDEIWPLVQRKLNILNKAGLSKDNFSDADTVQNENSAQTDIRDFWSELDSEVDFEIPPDDDDQSPHKRLKLP